MSWKEAVAKIRRVFEDQKIKWVEPNQTTVWDIHREKEGRCRGLYYIYPEVNFYFGMTSSRTNTICGSRFKPHYAKLKVDLSAMYGPPVPKKEPQWPFPEAWKRGVIKHLLEPGVDRIPSHYAGTNKKAVTPANLNFRVKHRVNPDNLLVLVWNLNHLNPEEIKSLETAIIDKLRPCCNT